MKEITEQDLSALRTQVMAALSQKRFLHTAAVEEMAVRLCALFCPEHTQQMRAAALLHDLTKEICAGEQEVLCHAYGLEVTEADRLSPKTFHARTAAAKIEVDFPQFADQLIVDAVRWHTTGHAGMTLTEKLLYLADYIDESRTFPACVILRRYFWGAMPQEMDPAGRLALLRDTLILSYQMTIRDLLDDGKMVAPDTVDALNELLLERAKAEA